MRHAHCRSDVRNVLFESKQQEQHTGNPSLSPDDKTCRVGLATVYQQGMLKRGRCGMERRVVKSQQPCNVHDASRKSLPLPVLFLKPISLCWRCLRSDDCAGIVYTVARRGVGRRWTQLIFLAVSLVTQTAHQWKSALEDMAFIDHLGISLMRYSRQYFTNLHVWAWILSSRALILPTQCAKLSSTTSQQEHDAYSSLPD